MKYTLAILLTLAVGAPGALGADETPAAPDKPKRAPEEVFKKIDKDTNGSISLEEFKASRKKDPDRAETVFKRRDKDGDGKLTFEEFKAGAGPKKNRRKQS